MCSNQSRKDQITSEDSSQEDIQCRIDALFAITLWTQVQRTEYTKLAWKMDSIRRRKREEFCNDSLLR